MEKSSFLTGKIALCTFVHLVRKQEKIRVSLLSQTIIQTELRLRSLIASHVDVFTPLQSPLPRRARKIGWQAQGTCPEETIPHATAGENSPKISSRF